MNVNCHESGRCTVAVVVASGLNRDVYAKYSGLETDFGAALGLYIICIPSTFT